MTQLIHVAATLGIADLLHSGPETAGDLAATLSVDADALYRVLRALASFGVFVELPDGRFALTPLAESLRSSAPGSLRGSAMLYGDRWWWDACGALLHSVRTGETAFDQVHGKSLFAHLDDAAEARAVFDEHQTNMTEQDARAVVEAYDFTAHTLVVDVGGGQGALAAAILHACPRTSVLLFDRPTVIPAAEDRMCARGFTDRASCLAGDFFASVPEGGDAYVLKDILHDWDDARAVAILQNCRAAMQRTKGDRARVLVIEKVIPPGNEPFPGKLTDITMLLITGGRERTAEQYRALLAGAGFTVIRIVPTASAASVIEAAAVRDEA